MWAQLSTLEASQDAESAEFLAPGAVTRDSRGTSLPDSVQPLRCGRSSTQQLQQQRFLDMHAVLRLVVDHGPGTIDDIVRRDDITANG